MATPSTDPRTIVTPDAFSVDPPLLGTPLGQPLHRGAAVLIDVLVVILITALTSGVWFILGVVAAAFFFTRAKKQGEADRASKMFRFVLGCMGVMTLSLTAIVFLGIQFVNRANEEFGPDFSMEVLTETALGGVVGGISEAAQLRSTDDPAAAGRPVDLPGDRGSRRHDRGARAGFGPSQSRSRGHSHRAR